MGVSYVMHCLSLSLERAKILKNDLIWKGQYTGCDVMGLNDLQCYLTEI